MGKLDLVVEPGKHDFSYTRVFDAPRELVYRAHADPALLQQWMGPRDLTNTVFEYDARRGGSYRFVQSDGQGNEYGFFGVIHDIVPNERVIQTFEFAGARGHVSLETTIFEDYNGKTLLRGHSVFQSVEDRDAMIESGMESGMTEGYERLDEILERLKKGEAAAQ